MIIGQTFTDGEKREIQSIFWGENDKNGFKTRAKYLLRACLS